MSEPYRVELDEGRSIVAFFYNGKLSGDISFSQTATADADRYAADWLQTEVNRDRLARNETQLLLIATDGELYGHHQSYRDQFLHQLSVYSVPRAGMVLTFPSRYLRQHPPRRRIRIHNDSSWSCHHGVERWGRGCGCTPGDTSWKPLLRQALDLLADQLDDLYRRYAPALFADPEAALRDFLAVWQGHSPAKDFLAAHAAVGQKARPGLAVRLLRSQMYKHQMYTSCAWFFEDIDRIEPKNALAAAAIIFRLVGRLLPADLPARFETILAGATSQHTGLNGQQLYRRGLRWAAHSARPSSPAGFEEVAQPTEPELEQSEEAVA